MFKLTEREAEVARLRDEEGMSWRAIAIELGTSKSSVNSSYRNVITKRNSPPKPNGHAIEVKDPERAAEVLDIATDPFMTIRAAAKECGFPPSTLHQFMKRIEARYKPLGDAITTLKNEEMVKLLEDRARRIFNYMDDFAMATAGLKDLAIAGGVVIDKARLLKDEPTQIVTMQDRRHLDELGAEILREMNRRGITFDAKTIGITAEEPLSLDSPAAVEVKPVDGDKG